MYTILVVITGLISNIFPPVGREYGKTISIPMLGNQEIHSRVITKNSVDISLKGLVNLNGTAKYLKSEDREVIVLSYNLRKALKTLQVDFGRPEYDSKRDRVIFCLKIKPLFYSKNIILERDTTCV